MEQNRAGGGARRLRIGVTAPQGDGPEGRRVVGRPCGPESRRADQGRSTTKPTLLTAPAAQPPPPAPLGSYNSDRYIPRCSRCIRYILYIRYIRYSNTRAIHPIRHILNPQARAKRRRNHSQCLPHKKYNNKKQYTVLLNNIVDWELLRILQFRHWLWLLSVSWPSPAEGMIARLKRRSPLAGVADLESSPRGTSDSRERQGRITGEPVHPVQTSVHCVQAISPGFSVSDGKQSHKRLKSAEAAVPD